MESWGRPSVGVLPGRAQKRDIQSRFFAQLRPCAATGCSRKSARSPRRPHPARTSDGPGSTPTDGLSPVTSRQPHHPPASPELLRDPALPGCRGIGSIAPSMVVPAPGRNRANPSRERRSRHTASGTAENPAGAGAGLKRGSSGPTGSETGGEPMCRRRGSGGRTVATRRAYVVTKAGAVMVAAQG